MKTHDALVATLAALLAGTVSAQTTLPQAAEQLRSGCQQELNNYCKSVTPGEARVFACLYAYSDKLSAGCEQALYGVASELEYVVAKLNYVADACSPDLARYCSAIKAGEGRLADCLKRNQAHATPACQQALRDTGLHAP